MAAHSVYLKFREKRSMDWAMAAAAVALHTSGGKVMQARIVLGGVAPIPWRVPESGGQSEREGRSARSAADGGRYRAGRGRRAGA